jgi:hypothetical protein
LSEFLVPWPSSVFADGYISLDMNHEYHLWRFVRLILRRVQTLALSDNAIIA